MFGYNKMTTCLENLCSKLIQNSGILLVSPSFSKARRACLYLPNSAEKDGLITSVSRLISLSGLINRM